MTSLSPMSSEKRRLMHPPSYSLDCRALVPPWAMWDPKRSQGEHYWGGGPFPRWEPTTRETGVSMWCVMGHAVTGVVTLTEEGTTKNAWLVKETVGVQFLLERDVGILRMKCVRENPRHKDSWGHVRDIIFDSIPYDEDLYLFARSLDGTPPVLSCCEHPQRSQSPASLLMQTLAHGNWELQNQVDFARQRLARQSIRSLPHGRESPKKKITPHQRQQLSILQKEKASLLHQHETMSQGGYEKLLKTLALRDEELFRLRATHKDLLVFNRTNTKKAVSMENQESLESIEFQCGDEIKLHNVRLKKMDDDIRHLKKSIEHIQACMDKLAPELTSEKEKVYNEMKEAERLMKVLHQRTEEEQDLKKNLILAQKTHKRVKSQKFKEGEETLAFLRLEIEQTERDIEAKNAQILQREEQVREELLKRREKTQKREERSRTSARLSALSLSLVEPAASTPFLLTEVVDTADPGQAPVTLAKQTNSIVSPHGQTLKDERGHKPRGGTLPYEGKTTTAQVENVQGNNNKIVSAPAVAPESVASPKQPCAEEAEALNVPGVTLSTGPDTSSPLKAYQEEPLERESSQALVPSGEVVPLAPCISAECPIQPEATITSDVLSSGPEERAPLEECGTTQRQEQEVVLTPHLPAAPASAPDGLVDPMPMRREYRTLSTRGGTNFPAPGATRVFVHEEVRNSCLPQDEPCVPMKTDENRPSQSVRLCDVYEELRPLGTGAFSRVVLGKRHDTGELRALKIVTKSATVEVAQLLREKNLLEPCGYHPHVLKMYEIMEDDANVTLSLEFVEHGDMFSWTQSARPSLTEADVARVVAQLFRALEFLHSLEIVHGNLRPDSLLVRSTDPLEIVLCDFILSTRTAEEEARKKDIWNAGVLAYYLISGTLPCHGEWMSSQVEALCGSVGISEKATHFLRCLLCSESPIRLCTAKSALDHPWLQTFEGPGALVPALRHPMLKSEMRREFDAVRILYYSESNCAEETPVMGGDLLIIGTSYHKK